MASRLFLFLIVSLLAFAVSLVICLIVVSASSHYAVDIYIRPNTTLVLRGSSVPSSIQIERTAAAIEVYDRATQVTEYNMNATPVTLRLVRWLSTNESFAIPVGQTQGQVEVSVRVSDEDGCFGDASIKFALQTRQDVFSYTPWVFTYLHEVLPGQQRAQVLSSSIDECYQAWLLLYTTNSPVSLRSSEVSGFFPIEDDPSGRSVADTAGRAPPLLSGAPAGRRAHLARGAEARMGARLGEREGVTSDMLGPTARHPINCPYRLDINLTSYSYDVTSIPNLVKYTPSETQDTVFYSPIAIRGITPLEAPVRVSVRSGSVARQQYGITQVICLTTFLGAVFLVTLGVFVSGQCIQASRARRALRERQEQLRQQLGDALTYRERRKLEQEERRRLQKERIQKAKERLRREREADKMAALEAKIMKRSLARRSQGAKKTERADRRHDRARLRLASRAQKKKVA